jgi:transmembrane sensor
MDDLLVKYLLHEADEAELEQVQQWISLNPANQRYLADFSKIWEESRNLAIHSTVNEDNAWMDFQQRIGMRARRSSGGSAGGGGDDTGMAALNPDDGATAGSGRVISKMVNGSRQLLRVAAIFLLVFAGSWLYYNYGYKPAQYVSVRSDNKVFTDTLPEGTVVTLNRQSSIRYRRQFAGEVRSVELQGEAFFDVTPDINKPFLVYTKGVLIKVIGTSFNVRMAGSATEVIVETGRVEVTRDQHTISLGSHEKALVTESNVSLVKQENKDDLYNYYRTHEFECNGISLGRLVEKLNEVYGAHIVIGNGRLRDLSLTTTFRDESLDEILTIVTRTLKINLVHNGSEIILQ